MPKVPTNWSNNNVKNPTRFTAPSKSTSAWANNIVKKLASFVVTGKGTANWQGTASAFTPYLYDDATINYDSATRGYDYTVAQSNQLNRKNPTQYTVVV